jgi:hypothetical protein
LRTHNTIDSEERLIKVYKELQFLIALGNASYAGKSKGSNLITQGIYSGAYASFFLVFNKDCKNRYELQSWKADSKEIFDFWH